MPKKKTLVKTYKGNHEAATRAFQVDAEKMAAEGYYPVSQDWAPGAYGCGSFLLALLLCLILIGILVFIYVLIEKPDGTLSVTYELREEIPSSAAPAIEGDTKVCPRCAETVKAAAVVCRYCQHEFSSEST